MFIWGLHNTCTAVGLVLLCFPPVLEPMKSVVQLWCVSWDRWFLPDHAHWCGVLKIFTGSYSFILLSKEKANRTWSGHRFCFLLAHSLYLFFSWSIFWGNFRQRCWPGARGRCWVMQMYREGVWSFPQAAVHIPVFVTSPQCHHSPAIPEGHVPTGQPNWLSHNPCKVYGNRALFLFFFLWGKRGKLCGGFMGCCGWPDHAETTTASGMCFGYHSFHWGGGKSAYPVAESPVEFLLERRKP